MPSGNSTTIKVKNSTLERLAKLKPHPRCTHSDVIELLLDAKEKKKVKFDGSL